GLDGGSCCLPGYLRRISERERAEEALSLLAAIVGCSGVEVVGKGLHRKVVSWNAGAERMFGYPAAEMLGQPITRLLSPDRPEEETQIIEEAKSGHIRHVETVRIRKDGQPFDVSLTVSPIKNAAGVVVGV